MHLNSSMHIYIHTINTMLYQASYHTLKINRWKLLIKANNTDPDLQMLLKLVDLLASCSEGENLLIESVCQNIMSINELLEVANNKNYHTYVCTIHAM